jgi:hypothetical protein
MRFEDFTFGSIRIDGVTYEHDVVIDRGQTEEKTFQKISGRIWIHAAVS